MMLKFQKARFSHEVDIVYRKKERLFSIGLLKGFALALSLHLALFVLFRVVIPDDADTMPPLPPITVDTHVSKRPVHAAPQITYHVHTSPTYFALPDVQTAPSQPPSLSFPDFEIVEHFDPWEADDLR